jgi:hypothetical protein
MNTDRYLCLSLFFDALRMEQRHGCIFMPLLAFEMNITGPLDVKYSVFSHLAFTSLPVIPGIVLFRALSTHHRRKTTLLKNT